MCLIWHEAGNGLYHDRFDSLSEEFDLDVMGPNCLKGKTFSEQSRTGWNLYLFNCFFSFHWLTFFSFRMLKKIRKNSYDIIYIHEEPHSIVAFLIVLFCKAEEYVLESSVINMKGNLRGFNPFERVVYSKVKLIFPKNKEVTEILVNRGAERAKITQPVGNGVSKKTFCVIDKTEARKYLEIQYESSKLNFRKDIIVVGYAGRIWYPKGIEILIKLKQDYDLDIIVCGSVSDPDLLQSLKEVGIKYLGSLSKDSLNYFYASLDLFILPSLNTTFWREQFGRVCAEAIYSGTPAIGSNVGGIPMVIGEKFTFEASNYQSFQKTFNLFSNEDFRKSTLKMQQKRIKNHFSWDSIAKQVKSYIGNEM